MRHRIGLNFIKMHTQINGKDSFSVMISKATQQMEKLGRQKTIIRKTLKELINFFHPILVTIIASYNYPPKVNHHSPFFSINTFHGLYSHLTNRTSIDHNLNPNNILNPYQSASSIHRQPQITKPLQSIVSLQITQNSYKLIMTTQT